MLNKHDIIQRIARRASERQGYGQMRTLHLREEAARSLANRPDGAKASTLAGVFAETITLMVGEGADPQAVEALARHEAADFVKKALRLRKH